MFSTISVNDKFDIYFSIKCVIVGAMAVEDECSESFFLAMSFVQS